MASLSLTTRANTTHSHGCSSGSLYMGIQDRMRIILHAKGCAVSMGDSSISQQRATVQALLGAKSLMTNRTRMHNARMLKCGTGAMPFTTSRKEVPGLGFSFVFTHVPDNVAALASKAQPSVKST